MNVLVTGGAGYIGSHACVELVSAGHLPVIFDDFSASKESVPGRIQRISGKALPAIVGDIRDTELLSQSLKFHKIDAVVHLAGLKSASQSLIDPERYQEINVRGTEALVRAMLATGVRKLVFASSAAVYREADFLPITEDHPLGPRTPYGISKLAAERELERLAVQDRSFKIAILRFFNAAGAHPSGLIGEDPRFAVENVMPQLLEVATGRAPFLQIYGSDYPTIDGTAARDYLHVVDLAVAQVRAVESLANSSWVRVNLGAGRGLTVLQLVEGLSRSLGKKLPYKFAPRRDGDVATSYTSVALASEMLCWRAERTLDEMCGDVWCWELRRQKLDAAISRTQI